ncbi:hypothetical protein J7435_19720, partial [Xanthomonas phaseoli pv. dieffenbachiae]|uniref:hypothetical protein n=1 Tax=Xanthomonas phaseoli TaxID=1985254 RepID=UPI001ADAEBA8
NLWGDYRCSLRATMATGTAVGALVSMPPPAVAMTDAGDDYRPEALAVPTTSRALDEHAWREPAATPPSGSRANASQMRLPQRITGMSN